MRSSSSSPSRVRGGLDFLSIYNLFGYLTGWKRLLLADGPRQSINALTLYAFYLTKKDKGPWWDLGKYFAGNDLVTTGLTISTAFTVLVFAGSCLLLIVAGVCYIPLLCHIQGNLKEYCCHKVDKVRFLHTLLLFCLTVSSQRIAEIIKRKNKQRLAKAAALARKEAAGDFSHLKNKKGELIAQPLPQPTLPNVSLDDEEDGSSMRTRAPPSTYTGQSDYYYGDRKEYGADYSPAEYPPMPAYNQPGYHQYNPSMGTLTDDHHYDDNDYGSTANLTLGAAPISYPDDQPAGNDIFAPRPMHGGHQQQQNELYAYNDPHAAYRGPSPMNDPHAAYRGPSPMNGDPHAAYRGPSPMNGDPHAAYRGPSPANGDPHAAYRGPSPSNNQAPAYDLAYDDGQQYHQQQQQHHTQDAYGYGYPSNDHQRGAHEAYGYDAGQVHAI